MKKPLFIVLEGLDGSGKSSVVEHLAKLTGAEKLSTPLPNINGSVRESIESAYAGIPMARALFYASSVVAASKEVERMLAEGKSVIMDRYWLSTLCYHKLMGVEARFEEVADTLRPPDATFLLNVPAETRRSRISQRGNFQDHDHLTLDPKNETLVIEYYRQMATHRTAGWFNEIRPGEMTVDEISDHIYKQLITCLDPKSEVDLIDLKTSGISSRNQK